MATSTEAQAKKDLRKQMKHKLSALSESEINSQSTTAQNLIIKHPKYQSAQRLSIYLSMPAHELQTTTLVRHALESGKKVFVPYIYSLSPSQKAMDMLHLTSISELDSLKPDSWGIPSLPAAGISERENAAGGKGISVVGEQDFDASDPGRDKEESLDVVVMPGVAFDEGLSRLGHGAGFYDGFLSRFCGDGSGKPWLVGLCLAEQLLPPGQEVPTTMSDWIVDAVAVGDGRLMTLDD